jgi:hypothetical protein
MILDAAETVLGIFGFDRTVYYDGGNFSSNKLERNRKLSELFNHLHYKIHQ